MSPLVAAYHKLFCAFAVSLLGSRLTNDSLALVKLASIIATTVMPFDATAVTVSMPLFVHHHRRAFYCLHHFVCRVTAGGAKPASTHTNVAQAHKLGTEVTSNSLA